MIFFLSLEASDECGGLLLTLILLLGIVGLESSPLLSFECLWSLSISSRMVLPLKYIVKSLFKEFYLILELLNFLYKVSFINRTR